MDIKKQIVNELHRPVRRRFERRKFIQKGIGDTLSADLTILDSFKKENSNFAYLLVVVDNFSKFCLVRPLKTKRGEEVSKAMDSILNEYKFKVKNLHTDQGTEFFNVHFKNLMKKYKINHYHTFSEIKASIVERLQRTLKEKLWKTFSYNGSYNWINYIQKIVSVYNATKHRTIKMKPIQVNKKNEKMLLKTVYRPDIMFSKPKFKRGQYVRISRYKGIFEKGYEPNYSTETFQIEEIKKTTPTTYLLTDYQNNLINGSFYEHEMIPVKYPGVYLVEKIIRKRGNEVLVKWLGFDAKHNTYIHTKDLI